MNRLGVVICTWTRAEMLAATLHSLATVRSPSGCVVDVLVVDNNSLDDTEALVCERRPGWPLGRLHALFEPRQRKQFALNAAIAHAREIGSNMLAFTDDDIVFPPDWLEQTDAICRRGRSCACRWPHGTALACVRSTELVRRSDGLHRRRRGSGARAPDDAAHRVFTSGRQPDRANRTARSDRRLLGGPFPSHGFRVRPALPEDRRARGLCAPRSSHVDQGAVFVVKPSRLLSQGRPPPFRTGGSDYTATRPKWSPLNTAIEPHLASRLRA